MKNIKKKIINDYHNIQLNELKDQVGIEKESIYVKTRSKLFIPSVISLASSFALVIVAFVLFINASSNKGQNPSADPTVITNDAIRLLELNTLDYIKTPIKTVFDIENNLFISIYYGIIDNELNQLNHYIVILYESETSVYLETVVTPLSQDAGIGENLDNIFNSSLQLTGDGVLSFDSLIVDIKIQFVVEANSYVFELDLNEYYEFLTK